MSDSMTTYVVLPDEEQERAVAERTNEMLYEEFKAARQLVDDRVSGFWKTWKPQERYERVYLPNLPVFAVDNYSLALLLEAIDQGTIEGPLSSLLLGMWQEMAMFRPDECVRMLRDLAAYEKAQERKVLKAWEEMLDETES